MNLANEPHHQAIEQMAASLRAAALDGVPIAPIRDALATAGGIDAAYAVQEAYGIGFPKAVYLWIPVLGNILAVITGYSELMLKRMDPTDPLRTGPFGTKSIVLRHPESQTTFSHHREPEEGLLKISVEEVVSAARFLLGSSHA